MTVLNQEHHGASVRLDGFWPRLRTRLQTTEVATILNGGSLWLGDEDYSQPEGNEDAPWGRLVILGTETLWPGGWEDTAVRRFGWLVRAEMNDFQRVGYRAAVPLERLQQIAFEQLDGWLPPSVPGDFLPRLAAYRVRPPQPMPLWDDPTRLWWTSSEYRCEATRLV